ncbi:hypothetical protein RchiOBHm_Chr6g0258801 [Rosa chinensis]|uniref:Uncharacterized protein n=1 Tax=Rosa chinensis TaxID=74649 RepID=A0A2P6PMQ8_ROSCH|nr:hypothetical protein RchiOBHm_Chr6g0258801 [Rosa chinensis]
MYYDLWFESESSQPFFYWLDVGDGKETNLEICSRTVLQSQCIKYLGPDGFLSTVGTLKWVNHVILLSQVLVAFKLS